MDAAPTSPSSPSSPVAVAESATASRDVVVPAQPAQPPAVVAAKTASRDGTPPPPGSQSARERGGARGADGRGGSHYGHRHHHQHYDDDAAASPCDPVTLPSSPSSAIPLSSSSSSLSSSSLSASSFSFYASAMERNLRRPPTTTTPKARGGGGRAAPPPPPRAWWPEKDELARSSRSDAARVTAPEAMARALARGTLRALREWPWERWDRAMQLAHSLLVLAHLHVSTRVGSLWYVSHLRLAVWLLPLVARRRARRALASSAHAVEVVRTLGGPVRNWAQRLAGAVRGEGEEGEGEDEDEDEEDEAGDGKGGGQGEEKGESRSPDEQGEEKERTRLDATCARDAESRAARREALALQRAKRLVAECESKEEDNAPTNKDQAAADAARGATSAAAAQRARVELAELGREAHSTLLGLAATTSALRHADDDDDVGTPPRRRLAALVGGTSAAAELLQLLGLLGDGGLGTWRVGRRLTLLGGTGGGRGGRRGGAPTSEAAAAAAAAEEARRATRVGARRAARWLARSAAWMQFVAMVLSLVATAWQQLTLRRYVAYCRRRSRYLRARMLDVVDTSAAVSRRTAQLEDRLAAANPAQLAREAETMTMTTTTGGAEDPDAEHGAVPPAQRRRRRRRGDGVVVVVVVEGGASAPTPAAGHGAALELLEARLRATRLARRDATLELRASQLEAVQSGLELVAWTWAWRGWPPTPPLRRLPPSSSSSAEVVEDATRRRRQAHERLESVEAYLGWSGGVLGGVAAICALLKSV